MDNRSRLRISSVKPACRHQSAEPAMPSGKMQASFQRLFRSKIYISTFQSPSKCYSFVLHGSFTNSSHPREERARFFAVSLIQGVDSVNGLRAGACQTLPWPMFCLLAHASQADRSSGGTRRTKDIADEKPPASRRFCRRLPVACEAPAFLSGRTGDKKYPWWRSIRDAYVFSSREAARAAVE